MLLCRSDREKCRKRSQRFRLAPFTLSVVPPALASPVQTLSSFAHPPTHMRHGPLALLATDQQNRYLGIYYYYYYYYY